MEAARCHQRRHHPLHSPTLIVRGGQSRGAGVSTMPRGYERACRVRGVGVGSARRLQRSRMALTGISASVSHSDRHRGESMSEPRSLPSDVLESLPSSLPSLLGRSSLSLLGSTAARTTHASPLVALWFQLQRIRQYMRRERGCGEGMGSAHRPQRARMALNGTSSSAPHSDAHEESLSEPRSD